MVKDLTGQKFGRLTIISKAGITKNGGSLWKCKCTCGSYTTASTKHLQRGSTRSCGCIRRERAAKLNLNHGLTKHSLFSIWRGIRRRCYESKHQAYKDYGGRGISVCSEWKTNFKSFYDWAIKNGWKEGLTIDRVDNDGNYEPENCQFISQAENNVKQRLIRSNNTSGYKGVHFNKREQKYAARIQIAGQTFHLGYFADPINAAIAYDKKARGADDCRSINFP